MKLNYCFEPNEGEIDSPSLELLVEYILKLSIDDFLILYKSENEWGQVRRETANNYRIEVFDEQTWALYETDTIVEKIPTIKVIDIFTEFVLFGIDIHSHSAKTTWIKSPYEIEKKVNIPLVSNEIIEPYVLHTNGYEFEDYIANTLREDGWETRLTKKSGDQGLDVFVYDENYKVALQCKRYSYPVGNSAIQEIHAAADFIGASHAVVITTSTYTSSAKELAEALGVILLHENELLTIRSHLRFISPRLPKKKTSIFIS